jgi:hypothetical protein
MMKPSHKKIEMQKHLNCWKSKLKKPESMKRKKRMKDCKKKGDWLNKNSQE